MRSKILFAVALLLAAHTSAESDAPAQESWYDKIDIQSLLTNKRLWLPYMKCVLDQGKCSPEGKELKADFKEALEHQCEKCSPQQRHSAQTIVRYLIEKEPEIWHSLVEKYGKKIEYLGVVDDEYKGQSKLK